MKVLVISEAGGVSEYYRTVTPYRLLHEAGLIELTVDAGQSPAIIDHLNKFDVVVFSRADSADHSLILLHAKMLGKRVVFDMDDNLLLIPPSIGVFNAWHQRGTGAITPRLYYLKKNIRLADALTVSTEALGRQLCSGEPHRLREGYTVLENMVLAKDWANLEPVGKPPEQVWIGWWGIYNHWDDWREIAPVIEPVIMRRPEARLMLLGMPELAQLFPELKARDQLMIGPFIEPEDLLGYRRMLAACDVCLAPTADYPFNHSKSDLKLLQYAAAGVPVIASMATYSRWKHQALVVGSPSLWGMALEAMLNNPGHYREQAAALQSEVLATRTYENRFTDWLAPLRGEGRVEAKVKTSRLRWPDMVDEAGAWELQGEVENGPAKAD